MNIEIESLPSSDSLTDGLTPESDRILIHKQEKGTFSAPVSSFIQNFSSLSFTLLPEENILETVQSLSDEEMSIKLPDIPLSATSALINFVSYPSQIENTLRFYYYNNSTFSGTGHYFRQSYTVKKGGYARYWYDSHRIWIPIVDQRIYLKLTCTNKVEISLQGYS